MPRLAVLPIVFAFACGGGDPEPTPEPPAAPEPTEILPPRPRTDPVPAPAPAAGDWPPECIELRGMLERLSTCERLGAQRDVLRKQFDGSWRAWGELPADQRAKLGTKCASTRQSLFSAVAAACSW